MIVERVAYGKDYEIEFCGGTCSEVPQGKRKLAVASNQTKLSVSAIFNVSRSVEKWLLTKPFYEIKSCGVVPSVLHKNKMKKRIL